MMSATLEKVEKPESPNRAAAELEVVLSKSLFVTTPDCSDFEGSYSLSESDISRDSAIEWSNGPERRNLPVPRSISNPHSRQNGPPAARRRPPAAVRAKSVGVVAPNDTHHDVYELSKTVKSLIDDDSCTAASSVEHSVEQFAFIANIGDMKDASSPDRSARSVGSRKSKRSRRSTVSRKRGDSLEREISLTILQTATDGANSAHFLVNKSQELLSPVKSAEEILGDLFVSQDVSLEPLSLEEGAIEFRNVFPEEVEQPPSTSEDVAIPTKPTEPCLPRRGREGQESGEENGSDNEKAPLYAEQYVKDHQAREDTSATISGAPSNDSLFAFSDVVDEPTRERELSFCGGFQEEEIPIGSRWSPQDTLSKDEPPLPPPGNPPRFRIRPRPEFVELSVESESTPQEHSSNQEELLRASSTDQSTDRYQIEMESSTSAISVGNLDVSRSFVSASDGASEFQHALARMETASPDTSIVEEGEFELESEDSFNEKKVQEEIFLDKLVDIVQVARERPLDVQLAEFYKTESTETGSSATIEYPDDVEPAQASLEYQQRPSVEPVNTKQIGDDDHPDPELDDFMSVHGFGDSDDDSDAEYEEESEVGREEGWMMFDSSPFGAFPLVNDNIDDTSGSTASPPRDDSDKKSPESPTSITDFPTRPSAREKAKVIWWSKGQPLDDADLLSI